MGIFVFYLVLYSLPFEVLNDSLVFSIGSKKAEILDIKYAGPPLPGYERTEPKLIGEVKNVGDGVIIGGRIEITAYGKEMRILLNKRESKIAFWLLEPQETSPFCLYLGEAIRSSDDIKAIKIGLIEQESMIYLLERLVDIDKSVYHGLEIVNFGILVDTIMVYGEPITNHYIRGKIVNTGKRTTQSNTIVALFYDERDNLIDYKKHSIFGEELSGAEIPPGDSRIFRLDVPQYVIRYKGYRYRLNILSVAKE